MLKEYFTTVWLQVDKAPSIYTLYQIHVQVFHYKFGVILV